jgi:Rieske Fe-S protein
MNERRRFLKVIGATAVGLAGVPACGDEDPVSDDDSSSSSTSGGTSSGGASSASSSSGGNPTIIEPGNVSSLPEDSLLLVPGNSVYIGRDAGGVYAMTTVCTHKSCNMVNQGGLMPDGTIDCSCHGSQFDWFGEVLAGPAVTPLPHYHVAIDANGDITIDTAQIVDGSVRAPIP